MPPTPDAVTHSVGSVLAQSRLDVRETQILVSAATGLTRVQLITHDRHILTTEQKQKIDVFIARRLAGEPIAYLIGEREFFGRSFAITPDVLIPRPETELLVEQALACIAGKSMPRILDLGTGSGVLACTLALECRSARVFGSDRSNAALAVARANGQRLGANVEWIESDWFATMTASGFDLIVCNPPYIAADDAHLGEGDLRFEPRAALTDGADGLRALATIIAQSSRWLRGAGWLLVEHGFDQSHAVRELFTAAGWNSVESWRDLAGIDRVTGGRLGGSVEAQFKHI